MDQLQIRRAIVSEQRELEGLQRRISLTNAGDCDAFLAHPDAIEVPISQIAEGRVFVAEWNGVVVGFAAVEPRVDGETELDALFVNPKLRRRGIGRLLIKHCAGIARTRESAALTATSFLHTAATKTAATKGRHRRCG